MDWYNGIYMKCATWNSTKCVATQGDYAEKMNHTLNFNNVL